MDLKGNSSYLELKLNIYNQIIDFIENVDCNKECQIILELYLYVKHRYLKCPRNTNIKAKQDKISKRNKKNNYMCFLGRKQHVPPVNSNNTF